MFYFSPQRRKKRKEKQKNKLENLQCAEPAFTASMAILVAKVMNRSCSFSGFPLRSLRVCGV